ncbi:VCBS repeat-containing protein [Streptomyces sp. G1]|uniref:VCBS repeat-containing protein n=1 Tax=Streptomyces sp. G1 TaxID=361572 RepID=UPI00202DB884|nr:VCBS repeat-containing protein [Streptomyces sp. G1]MCM1968277.1 VCBS repeat-containing protein [Streptomyces sp. G1]
MTRRRAGGRLPRALTTLLTLILPLTAADLLSAPGAAAATPTKPEVISAGAFEGVWAPSADGLRPVPCNGWIRNSGLALIANLRDIDGGSVTAQFVVTTAAGVAVPVPKATTVSSGGTSTTKVQGADLPTGAYKWKVRARDEEGAYSAFTADCGFNVDADPPTEPVTVTKEDGTPLTTQQARTKLRLKFKNPATDLAGFCWSMDRPIPVSSTTCGGANWIPLAPGATEATAEVTLTQRFGHSLYVHAVDKAGNASPSDGAADVTTLHTSSPTFVYPAGQTPLNRAYSDLVGDLNGDGFPDLLAPEPDGGLRLYTSNGAGRVQVRTIADSGWQGALIAHGGDFTNFVSPTGAPDGYEDAIVRLGDNKLYLYPGNGFGDFSHANRRELIAPPGLGSAGWGRIQQIIAPGDLDQRTDAGFKKGNDLAVVECVDDACSGARLRIYSGRTKADGSPNQNQPFDFMAPGYTGGTTWKNYTILGIGDQNGDGVKDILARNKVDGKLYFYAGKIAADGKFGLAPRTTYATGGWLTADRPVVVSRGNAQGTVVSKTITDEGQVIPYKQFQPKAGDEQGDLWTTTPADAKRVVNYVDSAGKAATTTCPTGCLLFYPGGPTGLKQPQLVGASGWATSVTNLF